MPVAYVDNPSVIGGKQRIVYDEAVGIPYAFTAGGQSSTQLMAQAEKKEVAKPVPIASPQQVDALGAKVPTGVTPLAVGQIPGKYKDYVDTAYYNYRGNEISGLTIQEKGRPELGEFGKTTFIPKSELVAEREKYYAEEAKTQRFLKDYPYGMSTQTGYAFDFGGGGGYEIPAQSVAPQVKSVPIQTGAGLGVVASPAAAIRVNPELGPTPASTYKGAADDYGRREFLRRLQAQVTEAENPEVIPFTGLRVKLRDIPVFGEGAFKEVEAKGRSKAEEYAATPESKFRAQLELEKTAAYSRSEANKAKAELAVGVGTFALAPGVSRTATGRPFFGALKGGGVEASALTPKMQNLARLVGSQPKPSGLSAVLQEQRQLAPNIQAEAELMQLGRAVYYEPTKPYTLRLPASATQTTSVVELSEAGRVRVVSEPTKVKYIKPPFGFEAEAVTGERIPTTELTTTEVVSRAGEYVKVGRKATTELQPVQPTELLSLVERPDVSARITPQIPARSAFGAQQVSPYVQAAKISESRLANADVLSEPVFNKATGSWRLRTKSSAAQTPVDWSQPLKVIGGQTSSQFPITTNAPALVKTTRVTTQENAELLRAIREAKKPPLYVEGGQVKSRPVPSMTLGEVSDIAASKGVGFDVSGGGGARTTQRQVVKYVKFDVSRYDKPISWEDAVTIVKPKPPTQAKVADGGIIPPKAISVQPFAGGSAVVESSIARNLERNQFNVISQTRDRLTPIASSRQGTQPITRLTPASKETPKLVDITKITGVTRQGTVTRDAQAQWTAITEATLQRGYNPRLPAPTEPPRGGGEGNLGEPGKPSKASFLGLPGLPAIGGGGAGGRGRGFRRGQGSQYSPSLAGLLSGRLVKSPSGSRTGLEVRYQVARPTRLGKIRNYLRGKRR